MRDIDEVSAKIDALNVWDVVRPMHWALKPHGSAVPFFFNVLDYPWPGVKPSLAFIEGWQTFHEYMQWRGDRDFGFASSPGDFLALTALQLEDGSVTCLRHRPGHVASEMSEHERDLLSRMLWESYGMMMRLEANPKLPLLYADEGCMFARIEDAKGAWRDEPLKMPNFQTPVEHVAFPKDMLAAAKDLPVRGGEILEMALVPSMRCTPDLPLLQIYNFVGLDVKTGRIIFHDGCVRHPEGGLRAMWETMPVRLLAHLLKRKAIPSEIHVRSRREFRLVRPLCFEVPFKLCKVAEFSRLGKALQNLI